MDGRTGQYVPEGVPAWGNGPITGPAGHAIAGLGNAHDFWWDQQPHPWGSPNANPYTISIEHCKPGGVRNSTPLTPEQKAASFALIEHLCGAHGIPKRVYGTATPCDENGGITGHFSMDPLNRQDCPGDYPWQELQDYLDGKTGNGGGGVMWTRQADGSGMDARANHCGQGFMADLEARGETGVDGRMSETYVSGAQGYKSFLPLANGDILVWDGQNVTHDGALVCADLYRLLVAAQTPPQTPIPDEYVKAKAAVDALRAAGL